MGDHETVDVLVDRLLQLPLRRGELLVRNDRRFQEPAVIDGLLGEASVAVIDDPALGRKLAGLAHRAAEQLEPGVHGLRQVTRCRVLALAHFANAYRCINDLDEADRLLDGAFRLLGTEDDFPELARVFSILGSLRRGQRRLADAEAAIQKAIKISERRGDEVEQARALCQMGGQWVDAMIPQRAEAPLRQALALLDPEADPWAGNCVRYLLAQCYVDTGRFEAARRLFEKSQYLYKAHGHSLASWDWMDGLLTANEGNFGRAEESLRRCWAHFRRHRRWDWGISKIALDVASLYAQFERKADLRDFAKEMTPTLFCRGLHREAVTAIGSMLRAIRYESVGLETLRAVELYVRRSRFYPETKSPFV